MADEKLRQELYYMAKLVEKYDFKDMNVVEGILRQENDRKILESVFGTRFKSRIFDIAAGADGDRSCVICGKEADNGVMCEVCLKSILESNYAKNKNQIKENEKSGTNVIKEKMSTVVDNIKTVFKKDETVDKPEKKKLEFVSKLKNIFTKESGDEITSEKKAKVTKVFQYSAIVCLALILFIQIYILAVWLSLPTYNKKVKAQDSQFTAEAVSDEDAAYQQLLKDFPESEGYSIIYSRQDRQYVGKFLVDIGQCCEDVEEQLTPEERYDYFFEEDVYVFYISNISDLSAEIGMAEVNSDGAIILTGSFNNGRKTDCYYRFR